MGKKLITMCLVILFTSFQLQPLFASSPVRVPVLGQVVSRSVALDGESVPSGTTLLNKSFLSTESFPAVIHLSSGHLLELSKNSSAYLEKGSAGEVRVTVRRGTLSFREAKGKIVTAPAESVLVFDQRRQGQPVTPQQKGVVAVLTEEAPGGQVTIKVNDVSKIDPKQQILIKSRDGKTQEVHYIESIQDTSIKMTAALKKSFAAQDLVIQDEEEIKKAIAAGAAVVGTAVGVAVAAGAAAAAGLSTLAVVGIVAGVVAAAAVTTAAVAGGEEKPASPTTP